MYYDYFGFRQPPFKITPDTNLFYPGGERGAVLDALVYAILNGEGIVKVVGEVGSGKTMLCRMLEQELPEKVEIVYLANPSLAPENTVHAIAFELDLDVPAAASRFEIMNRLQEYLLEQHSKDRQVVVFVEEAQSMPLATLEEIRLLSNLETKQNKLLQIVLFGQPELDRMIASPEIRQLRERITYSFRLSPFQSDDIRDYLNSRVRACGYRADTLFDRTAVRDIERYSRGLLRRINILADKALLAAYAENTHRVTSRHIKKAATDSEFAADAGHLWRRTLPLLAGAAGLALIAGLGVWLAVTPADPEPASPSALQQDSGTGPAEPAATPPGSQEPDMSTGESPGGPMIKEENASETVSYSMKAEPDSESPGGKETLTAGTSEDAANGEENNTATIVTAGQPGRPPYTVIEFGGFDGLILSEAEAGALRRQLRTLPPETVVLSEGISSGEICNRCRSIIYRPLKRVENL